MHRAIQVPSALITVVNGLVVMFVVASDLYVRRAKRRYSAEAAMQQSKETTNQPAHDVNLNPNINPNANPDVNVASDRSPSLP